MLKKYIELIKERIPVSEIVGKTVKLRRVGSRLIGRCPFHQEKTPSFSVNDKGRFFYCFGCGKSGDVIDFISETKHLDLNEAIEELAASIGIKIEKKGSQAAKFTEVYQFLEQLRDWFCDNLDSRVGLRARRYIESRLDSDAITEFKLGYCPSDIRSFIEANNHFHQSVIRDSGVLDKGGRCYFRDRLTFPINNRQGKVIGFGSRILKDGLGAKYINSCETDFFKKGEVFYNLDRALKSPEKSFVLVEGYMDVIALHQCSYKNVLGVLGTSITAHHLKVLNQLGRNTIFCFDGDTAGIRAADRVVRLIMDEFIESLNIRTTFAFLPAGKDPADLVAEDKRAFQAILDNPKNLSDTLFYLAKYGQSYDSPEDFIELEKILQNYLSNVKDYKVKKHFQDFFYQQTFLLKREICFGNIGFKNKARAPSTGSYQDSAKLTASANLNTDKKSIFLKIALKFPEILQKSEFEEYFSVLTLKDPKYTKLQSSIVQFLNTPDKLNSQALRDFLLSNKETATSYQLIDTTISLPDDLEAATLLWSKLRKQLWLDDLQEEYRKIIQSSNLDEAKMEEANRILMKIREAKH